MASGLMVNARLSATSFVHETSIVAKLGCVLLSLLYALSYVVNLLKFFGITPGNLIPPNFWIWTIVTHQFLEVNFVGLIFGCLVLVFSSRSFEQTWNVIGFLTFFGIVTVLSGLLTGAFYLFCYMVTFNIAYLFDISIYGLGAYTAGILVALKQSKGDQMLVGTLGIYIKHLPLLFILLILLLKLVGFVQSSSLVHVSFGTLVSWTYLRFYQSHSRGRGDSAEKFAFQTFFPSPLDGPVGILSNTIFNILLKVKICRKTSYRYDVGAPSKITITLSGVDALDAERRRNKAIKALDERLQKAETNQEATTEWPDLDDEQTPIISSGNKKQMEDNVSSSSGSSPSDIVRIDVETSSPSDENPLL
uniref:Transmembrane protein 115-like n=1 Tax=Phallusia mammillata TaxID=59560 RepID=A0A6F9DV28_9ASCI|nr:transmembrane protein 115-like [Phallusia mammillata]